MKYDLSILIPARCEEFLSLTVKDILKNKRGKTEIIVILDGEWSNPPIESHEDVTVIFQPESIGQRAAQNAAAKISKAKYVMKVDAHCAFDEGFDVKMMEGFKKVGDDVTMVPVMTNLHVFDWVCAKCGKRWYMGPVPKKCPNEGCDSQKFEKDIIWKPKRRTPHSTSYCFNKDLRFKYFGGYKRRQKGDIVETMSLQGSCFMCTREKYWELGLCDESWGSWGQQGSEVALKTWLSGGRVVCNKKTWYAHMFRTRPGFNWPYGRPGSQGGARRICKEIFLNDKWPLAIHDLQWLLDKFAPVPYWHDEQKTKKKAKKPSKGLIYYTDNQLDEKIATACQKQLTKCVKEKYIVSASLKPMKFGKNIHLPLERGYLTMFKQQVAALEASTADIIFFCEHDVLYHPSHFEFFPPTKDVFYYNTNVWRVRENDGFAVRTTDCRQVSGLCAYRDLLLDHYRERVKMVEKMSEELDEKEFNQFIRKLGFEPGTHGRIFGFRDLKSDRWESKHPNVDIRRGSAVTRSKWKPEDYRNKRFAEGWQETMDIPSWGKFKEFFMIE